MEGEFHKYFNPLHPRSVDNSRREEAQCRRMLEVATIGHVHPDNDNVEEGADDSVDHALLGGAVDMADQLPNRTSQLILAVEIPDHRFRTQIVENPKAFLMRPLLVLGVDVDAFFRTIVIAMVHW